MLLAKAREPVNRQRKRNRDLIEVVIISVYKEVQIIMASHLQYGQGVIAVTVDEYPSLGIVRIIPI